MNHLKPAMQLVRAVVRDGWQNVLTGLGVAAMNKLSNTTISFSRMTEGDADELYSANDIARKVVDELPEEAFRMGYELMIPSYTPEKIKRVTEWLNGAQLNTRFIQAWKAARQYGGGALVPVTDDVMNFAQPANPMLTRRITNFLVVNRWELTYDRINYDISQPGYGLPERYFLVPRGGSFEGLDAQTVHASRVVRFEGMYLQRRQFIQNGYWGDSVLNPLKDHLRNLDASLEGVALALQDFSVAKYKLKDLTQMLAADDGGDEDITMRMQLVNLCRSIARCVVIDAEDEEFEYQQRNFSGVPDTLDHLASRLVAACDHLPHTKVLGEGPEGFGKNGEGEQTDWYDYVRSQQKNYAEPLLVDLLKRVFRSRLGPTGGDVPEFEIHWRPLHQLDEKEEAEAQKTRAESDQIYVDLAVLDPQEIRDSRFGSGKYSHQVQIDRALDKTLEDAREEADEVTAPEEAP